MRIIFLLVICLLLYWPSPKAEFVLDDYYTVKRNPLIKNPALYKDIWTSHLFDAHPSSDYIKLKYYRPVLQSSFILDYNLFGLKASGYQWVNLMIHWLNGVLVYVLLLWLFQQPSLAFRTALLFCVLPTQEWVVRYVTGRGDALSALLSLASLVVMLWSLRGGVKRGYVYSFIFFVLAALTRESAYLLPLFALLVKKAGHIDFSKNFKEKSMCPGFFAWGWIAIGALSFIVTWQLIGKLGNVQALHLLYFTSIGFCLLLARLRWVMVLVVLCAALTFYQGRFWTSEEVLLRHTRTLEWWPRTVAYQQLLMKYDEDIPAIEGMLAQSQDPQAKAMWLRRLGLIYFKQGNASRAVEYFENALAFYAKDTDTLNAYAIVCLETKQEAKGLDLLNRSLAVNDKYADTLRTLGVYYYRHQNHALAKHYLTQSLSYDPDNAQARQLLEIML